MSAEELQFFQLLDNLMSLDNAVRQQAEVTYKIFIFVLFSLNKTKR